MHDTAPHHTEAQALPPHVQRVHDEQADLATRLGALRTFMAGPVFEMVAPGHRDLLVMQADTMEVLNKILLMRLDMFRQEAAQ